MAMTNDTGAGRTLLADERTYLAWLRSGLSAFVVSLGAGKIVPAVTAGPRWPFQALGVGFAVIGVLCVGVGFFRQRAVADAISRGADVQLDELAIRLLVVVVVALGLALAVVVVAT
jgi:putative membrane protein